MFFSIITENNRMVKLEKKVLNSSKKDSSAKANEADTFCSETGHHGTDL